MRYIWKNIWLTLRKEPAVSLILMIGIFLSAFVLNFAVGIYHEFAREAWNAQNYMYYFLVTFSEADGRYVSKQALTECMASMKHEVTSGMDYFELELEVDPSINVYWEGSERYVGDITCIFEMKDGKPAAHEMLINTGRQWNEEEFESGAKVAYDLFLPFFGSQDIENLDLSGVDFMCAPYRSSDKKKFIINGEEYQIIGYQTYAYMPLVPLPSVDGDAKAVRMMIMPKGGAITRYQYEEIKSAMERDFGDLVQFPELEIASFDQTYYIMVFCITGLLALIAGVILTVSFQYILLQRRKTYGVYQLCGCKTGEVRRLFLTECMLVIGGIYLVSVGVYHWLALPILSQFCIFIREVANPVYYGLIGGVLLICSYLILKIMTGTGIKKEITRNLKGGAY